MELSPADVQRFLADQLKIPDCQVSPDFMGEWSQAFFVRSDRGSQVIRFSRVDEDFRKDQFAERFAGPDLPIPHLLEIGSAFDGYYAISERAEGDVLETLDTLRMAAFVPSLLSLLDALRGTDVSATTGYGSWGVTGSAQYDSWRDYLLSVTLDDQDDRIGWKANLARHPDAHAVFDAAYEAMQHVVPACIEARHLVHNDLLHYNVLVQGTQVTGVVDWGCGLYGDFLYDLAMFLLWQFYYPSLQDLDLRQEARLFFHRRGADLRSFDQRLHCYQLHLALGAIKCSASKNRDTDLQLITWRTRELLEDTDCTGGNTPEK